MYFEVETSTYVRSNMVFEADDQERTTRLTSGVLIFIPIIIRISWLERTWGGPGMQT
jgi:hypothetical protein